MLKVPGDQKERLALIEAWLFDDAGDVVATAWIQLGIEILRPLPLRRRGSPLEVPP